MPLHDFIRQIYEEVDDPLYIIRFLNYLVNTRYKRVIFTVNNITVEPLITGILEEKTSNKRFFSIAEFYSYATGQKVSQTDISILSKVFVTREYSVMRLICNIKEDEILNFFDQKYRTFLLYRDIKKRIKFYALKDANGPINLRWLDNDITVHHTKITCDKDITLSLKLLKVYEDGMIDGLYYCRSNSRHLISET